MNKDPMQGDRGKIRKVEIIFVGVEKDIYHIPPFILI